jgi:hypothetical protein
MSQQERGTASYSRTPQGRYESDPMFHRVVDMLGALIHEAQLTPSEVREAAVLACIHYEARKPPYSMYDNGGMP